MDGQSDGTQMTWMKEICTFFFTLSELFTKTLYTVNEDLKNNNGGGDCIVFPLIEELLK